MATGYGTERYGRDYYGAGLTSEPAGVSIIVQPNPASSGDSFIVGGSPHQFIDFSRNDNFNPTYNTLLWRLFTSGTTVVSGNIKGLLVGLRSSGSGSIYALTSLDEYSGGDLSVNYSIKSPYLADTTASSITYASMLLNFANGSVVVKRYLNDISKHLVSASVEIEGQSVLLGSINATNITSGTFRIIKYGGILEIYHDNIFLGRINDSRLNTFTVSIQSITVETDKSTSVLYSNYSSSTGIGFGIRPVLDYDMISPSRISGVVPINAGEDPVSVVMFNHFGVFGTSADLFTYILPNDVGLINQNGITANIINDNILRT